MRREDLADVVLLQETVAHEPGEDVEDAGGGGGTAAAVLWIVPHARAGRHGA